MVSDASKMFVGGISRETTEGDLQQYFSKYGNLVECNLKKDPNTGFSRGFAFIAFDDPSAVDHVVSEASHILGGKTIDPKRLRPKGSVPDCTKIFVGGVDPNLPESEIRDYFQQFGQIESINLPFDKEKNMRKGFCFINFESSDAVDTICNKNKHPLGDREVDVKRATPQENRGFASRGGFRGGSAGGAAWGAGGRGYPQQQMGSYAPYGQGGFGAYNSYPGYGQDATYAGYGSFAHNGAAADPYQMQGTQRQGAVTNRANRGGMNERYQPY